MSVSKHTSGNYSRHLSGVECRELSGGIIPIAAFSILTLGVGMLVSGIGSDLGLVRSVHAEETEVNVNIPVSLAITSHTPLVTINASNTNEFYTSSATIVSTTNNPTGYTLTMADKDTNTSLVNDDYDSTTTPASIAGTIDSIASPITVDSTGSNFTVNKWGYAKDSATTAFLPIPASTAADEVKVTDGPAETSTTTVTFGTKVNKDLVSGTYEDTVVFSLTANAIPPKDITRLTSMQDLANHPEYCANTAEHVSTTIKDERDNQEYTIFKAKDGNCWMGENLRYGVNPDGTGHPFVAADAALSDSGLNATKMLDLTYDATNPNTAGRIKNGESGMKTADNSRVAFYDSGDNWAEPYINIYQANDVASYDSQTKYGVIYNYCAVTGGTVCDTAAMSEDAPGSICPKGWKLPGMTADATGTGAVTDGSVKTYNNLANSYGYGNTQAGMNGMFSAPINLLRAGRASDGSLSNRSATGSGQYWSSTKRASTHFAYYLKIVDTSGGYVDQGSGGRFFGHSARCVSGS